MIREVFVAIMAGYAAGYGIGCAALPEVSPPTFAAGAFVYDQTEKDPELDAAVARAHAVWAAAGVRVPVVDVVIGAPPGLADGYCYCAPGIEPKRIVVRARRADMIAHELGHAAGLMHVHGEREIMAPAISTDAVIGPATLAEAQRVGALR